MTAQKQFLVSSFWFLVKRKIKDNGVTKDNGGE